MSVKRGCLTCLTYLIMIPCFCCMLFTALTAPYDDGQDAASSILDYQFGEELTEIEFIDEPPIAPVPGGASESSTWVVLELGEKEADKFERMIGVSGDWHEMPVSEELSAHGSLLQPPSTIEGIERKEALPITEEDGYYYFTGELADQETLCCPSFTIAIYVSKTKRLYIYTVSY